MRLNLRLLLLANISAVLASVTEMTDKIVKVGSLPLDSEGSFSSGTIL